MSRFYAGHTSRALPQTPHTRPLCNPLLHVSYALPEELSLAQVFLSHLHSDHHADLASLYVNAMFGRKVPLEIWGPSSEKPELGLAASIEGLRQVCCQNLPMYIMCQ